MNTDEKSYVSSVNVDCRLAQEILILMWLELMLSIEWDSLYCEWESQGSVRDVAMILTTNNKAIAVSQALLTVRVKWALRPAAMLKSFAVATKSW